MEGLANIIVGLFKELRLPLRWVAFISIFILVVLSLFVYEQLTGQFYFARLERKITLLKELQELNQDEIAKDTDLLPIYKSLVSELDNYEEQKFKTPNFLVVDFNSSVIWWKALSGASIWLLAAIFFTISEIRGKKFSGTTLGAALVFLVVAALMGALGAIIPTIFSPIVNYICFPIFQIVLLVGLAMKSSAKPKPAVTGQI